MTSTQDRLRPLGALAPADRDGVWSATRLDRVPEMSTDLRAKVWAVYELRLPDDFNEYAWEVEYKGVFWGAAVVDRHVTVPVTFYDRDRLAQDLAEEVNPERSVPLVRVIVVDRVTADQMLDAIARLRPGELA